MGKNGGFRKSDCTSTACRRRATGFGSQVQAADLPVKAKPVQYVKICTIYGDGYYYIPGSDTCIKMGGYVRAQYGWNASVGSAPGSTGIAVTPAPSTPSLTVRSRVQATGIFRPHRADLQVDTRTQTAYGTLRTYVDISLREFNRPIPASSSDARVRPMGRLYVRTGALVLRHLHLRPKAELSQRPDPGDTMDLGVNIAAYTVQLAPGLTFSISVRA